MALVHARAGEIFSAQSTLLEAGDARSHTLVRDPDLQIFRLELHAGQTLNTHQVPERMIIQCLEGEFVFKTMGKSLVMRPGDLCHIACDEPHSVHAQDPASALVFLYAKHAKDIPSEDNK